MEELEIANEKLHHESLRDELTGLYNRRGFMTLSEQHDRYARRVQKSYIILFADMDGLKQINDRFGHKEGDLALKQTAFILQESFRSVDIAGRIGGDEFVVLAVDNGGKGEAFFRKRLEDAFKAYNSKSEKPYKLSVSLGICMFDPNKPVPFKKLLTESDKLLYEEKKRKKGWSTAIPHGR